MKPRGFIAFLSILVGTAPLLDAAALGLGDATLRSRLNEPLEVEIALIGANIEADTPNAAIATEAMHDAAGITAVELLRRFRVEVSTGAEHEARVRISTEQAIREPIVRFLLVVENARQHVTREYTLLLDPPGYSLPAIAAPVPVPVPMPVLEPAPTSKAAVPALPAPPTERGPRQIGPVSPGDTLSKVAMRLRKDPGVTWAQMTWALFRANPGAFLGGDINMLRSNVYLRVPTAETASRWSHREALALVKGTPAPVARVPNLEPVTESPSSPVVALASPNVVVVPLPVVPSVPPEDESPATAPETVADSGSESSQPVFRLFSSDSVDESRTNGFVGAPMTAIEKERIHQLMVQANRQIEMSNEEMARDRERLAETEQQISSLVEAVAQKDSEIKGLESRLGDLREFAMQQSIAMVRPEPSWLNRLLLETLFLAAMVGVLAVVLSRWNDARRRQWASAEAGTVALALRAQASRPVQALPMAVVDEERPPLPGGEPPLPEEEPWLPEEEPRVETSVNEERSIDHADSAETESEGASLMEANAYFAYGYYDKAKEVLTEFIREHPAHAESRLIMLRTLHAIGEKRKFRRHAEALLELVDDSFDKRWAEAARLGRALFPEARLFDANVYKRTEDEDFEKTVWTGTRPDLSDFDEHVFLDIDDFKYVDLVLVDEADDAEGDAGFDSSLSASADFDEHVFPDIDDFKYVDLVLVDEADDAEGDAAPDSPSSASADSDDTGAEPAEWLGNQMGRSVDRRSGCGPADNSTDDEQA